MHVWKNAQMTRTNKRIKQGNTRKIKKNIYIIITIQQLYQRESYPNICRLYINNTLVYIYIYINMNQHCWLQNINIFSYLSDKSLIERQVAIKFARFLQISLPSLLNNHINLFLSYIYYIYHGSYELTYLNQRIRRMSWFK